MPCNENHFIPILDELRMREEEAEARRLARKRRGGPRPGSGPPKGNLNALKHGRYSTRHKVILEAILQVPEAREALVDVMKRNKKRQTQAELEAAYFLMRWLANSTNFPELLISDRNGEPDSPSPAHGREPALSGRLGSGEDTKPVLSGKGAGGRTRRRRRGVRENDQTRDDQMDRALADMEESLKRKLFGKRPENAPQNPNNDQTMGTHPRSCSGFSPAHPSPVRLQARRSCSGFSPAHPSPVRLQARRSCSGFSPAHPSVRLPGSS